MFQININNIVTIFSKFFSGGDSTAVLEAIPANTRKVLFVDTGSTPNLVATVRSLVERGVTVHIRDHHRGEGRTPEAAEAIVEILGSNAQIVDRAAAPGCASLVGLGEFSDADTIIADPDFDGLVAAMKAAGVTYVGMDSDAGVFDVRPQQSAETLTEIGWLGVRALSTLPPFNPTRPEVSEGAKRDLFAAFVAAASGDVEAWGNLERRVEAYEVAVAEAERLLREKVTRPCDGLAIADSVGANQFDLTTLTRGMEELVGVKVTGVRKDFGPIAGNPGGHGVQYSLAVVQGYQKEVDLRDLVPEGVETSPKAGLISNTRFLLHCSEEVWGRVILPGLESLDGVAPPEGFSSFPISSEKIRRIIPDWPTFDQ